MCVSTQALLRPFAQLVSRRKGRNMKIKYRFISETMEIKASDDWGNLFFEFVHQGYNMDHNQIHHQSQTHTLIAWVLTNVFLPILIGIIVNMVWSTIGRTLSPANAYEESNSSSQIVYHIELNQNVVVGDVPYYYEVEIQDESPGCRYTGYVSKRSICLTENDDNATDIDAK